MTREEATIPSLMGHIEALEETIKVLQPESCEDAISRQAVLNKIKEVCFSKEFIKFRVDYGSNGQRDFILNFIEELPSVTPAPKTGHWTRELIRNEKGGCIGAKMICSECGKDNKHDEYMNYCPNCGCRMVEPQERNDKE